MHDTIQKMKHSMVQHGPLNRRIYLMKLDPKDMPDILPEMDALASKNGYGRILAKVPGKDKAFFDRSGYHLEAMIPGFFKDGDDAVFMSKFFSEHRRQVVDEHAVRHILITAGNRPKRPAPPDRPSPRVRSCRESDVTEMTRLYASVFDTYPFPVFDPEYLAECMRSHNRYFCIRKGGRMVAAAASEVDASNRSVEMTDFATLPGHRSTGLARRLLQEMESAMKKQGMTTLFSIARSLSPAMNRIFSRCGYTYAGTLVNSTHIAGRIESMNVWYKQL